MNDRTDFERRLTTALAAYAEGAPVEVDAVTLTAAIAGRRAHRRWSFPDWAGAIGRPASPWAALLIVLGLTVALLVGAVAAGAFRSDPVRRLQDGRAIVTESPTPSATPAPSASLPIIDVPAGLSPKRTADQVEREVVGMIEANHVGLASVPVTVTKITLMPPGATYVYVDGSSGYPRGVVQRGLPVLGRRGYRYMGHLLVVLRRAARRRICDRRRHGTEYSSI